MNYTPVPEHDCPNCCYHKDCVVEQSGLRVSPSKGDFDICLNCGILLQYDENLKLVPVNKEQFAALPVEQKEEIRLVQEFISVRGRFK